MQISKVTLIAPLVAVLTLYVHAQSASPEQQNKALELLRQTIAQDQKQPSHSHATSGNQLPVGTVPAAGMPSQSRPAEMAQPHTAVMSSPASSDQQQQALHLLRQTIDQQRASEPQPSSSAKPANQASGATVRPSTSSAKPAKTAPGAGVVASGPGAGVSAQPSAPAEPAGPRTKQERLMDLLDQYRADKLTPAEYHAQRAKILSEP